MEKKKKITLFSFIIAFIMLVSTGIVLLTNNNQNKIVKAVYNNQFNATWSVFYWSGTQISNGMYVHKVGNDYYYDYNYNHYKLDTTTNTWNSVSWTGFQTINALQVWTDGTNYYYSSGATHYQLDYTNYTATAVTWSVANFYGENVWHLGNLTFLDSGSANHYFFDISTGDWATYNWGIDNSINSFWLDGKSVVNFNGYVFSNSTVASRRYVLDTSNLSWSSVSWNNYPSNMDAVCYAIIDNYLIYGRNYDFYNVDTDTNTFNSITFNYDNNITTGIQSGAGIYDINGSYYYYTGTVNNVSNVTLKLTMSNQNNNGNVTPDAFTGSNVYIPFTPGIVTATGAINGPQLQYSGSTNLIYYLDLQMSFGINQNDDYYITFTSNYLNNQSLVDITHLLDSSYSVLSDFIFTSNDIGSSIRFYLYDNNTYTDLGVNSPLGSNGRVVSVTVTISQDFTDFSFIGCHMFSDYTQDNNMYSINNHVRYFDANNGYIDISIYSYTSISSAVDMYASRMYYFEGALSEGSSYGDYISGYNQGYDDGYSDGLNSGNSQGYDEGYAEGYQDGVDDTYDNAYNTQYWLGYNTGYSEGVESSSPYTFSALIGAVIDTPIKYMTSLFNFNLLGINLLNFLLALLTLGVIVILIKKIL